MNIQEWKAMSGKEQTLWLEMNAPANERSIDARSMKLGVGINDAPYMIYREFRHEKAICPAYKTWSAMLVRAYCPKWKEKRPTYDGVTVTQEWHSFMSFRAWWMKHQVDGWGIDKDLLVAGNKTYSPDTCLFVPTWVNCLMIDNGASRGDLPIGVSINKNCPINPYTAQGSFNGRVKALGRFTTPSEAHIEYISTKLTYIDSLRKELDAIDQRLYQSIRDQIVAKAEYQQPEAKPLTKELKSLLGKRNQLRSRMVGKKIAAEANHG